MKKLPTERKELRHTGKDLSSIPVKMNGRMQKEKLNGETGRESPGESSSSPSPTRSSFKSTRKKDLKGIVPQDNCPSTRINNRCDENQVPVNLVRRDRNKTESTSCHFNSVIQDASRNSSMSKEPIIRETRTSRLRAASKTALSDNEPGSLKPTGDIMRHSKEKMSSVSPSKISPSKKVVDKSHTRKSHLNRSHTCEGVSNDVYVADNTNVRRRRTTNAGSPPLSQAIPDLSLSVASCPVRHSKNVSPSSGTLNGCKTLRSPRKSCGLAEKSGFRKMDSLPRHAVSNLSNSISQGQSSETSQSQSRRDSSCGKVNVVDISARAEMLTASTLKMITRLDEINGKIKKTQGNLGKVASEENTRPTEPAVLPSNAVIISDYKDNDDRRKKTAVLNRVPSFEDSLKKLSQTCNKVPRAMADTHSTSSPKNLPFSKIRNENIKTLKLDTNKSSILKNNLTNLDGANHIKLSKPVSILKRKSLPRDETQASVSPPVTFSPSALKKKNYTKKQGILKKRRSLDENEVLRKLCDFPDSTFADYKSILKFQRRSSLEELTRISNSPDSSTPQGILKRKCSKDEDVEENAGIGLLMEPQSILKRKSSNSSQQHVKILEGGSLDTSVASDASVGLADVQSTESVRPILKKKSSSEEHSASDVAFSDLPKSILKKKSSLENDEPEEKPKKPILKSSKMSSIDGMDNIKSCFNPIFSGNESIDAVKPILKIENSRTKHNQGSENVVDNAGVRNCNKNASSEKVADDLNAIRFKDLSPEVEPLTLNTENIASEYEKCSNVVKEEFSRPFVTEGSENSESFQNEPRKYYWESGNDIVQPLITNPKLGLGYSSQVTARSGDVESGLHRSSYPEESTSYSAVIRQQRTSTNPRELESEESSSFTSAHVNSVTSLKSYSDALEDVGKTLETKRSLDSFADGEFTDQLFRKTSFCSSSGSDQVSPLDIAARQLDDNDEKSYFQVLNSSGETVFHHLVSDDSQIAQLVDMNGKESEKSEKCCSLERSDSVSAKTSMFEAIEAKSKSRCVEDEKAKRHSKGSESSVRKRLERRLMNPSENRYHTQPISLDEIEQAVQKKKNSNGDEEKHEDELSALSYSERLRLFESTLASRVHEPTSRSRSSRFRTQPVTTEELETAKSLKVISDDNAALECGRASEKEPKSTNETEVKVKQSAVGDDTQKPKGILKNVNVKVDQDESEPCDDGGKGETNLIERIRKLKKDCDKSESFLAELKGILKRPSTARNEVRCRPLADSIPKQRSATALDTNLAAVLQKVEKVHTSDRTCQGTADENSADTKMLPKYLQNEAVARRLKKSRNNSSMVKSQSHSSVSSAFRHAGNSSKEASISLEEKSLILTKGSRHADETDDSCSRVMGGLRRSTTQPLGSSDGSTDDDMSGATIQERLARLKKNGEQNWQKRKSHVTNVEDELSVIAGGNYLFKENCLLRKEMARSQSPCVKDKEGGDSRSSILADRLGKLDAAKEGWKKRIQPSDAVRFSVEGKMLDKKELSSPSRGPLSLTLRMERQHRSPKAVKFKSKQCTPYMNSTPSSPMERLNNPISRSVSAPGSRDGGLLALSPSQDTREIVGPVVTVPKNDDETFTSFFNGIDIEKGLKERLEINDEDLDVVTQMKSSQLLVQKRNIKTQRRRVTERNPLKTLAARLDLQEYTDIKTGVAEKELKRIRIEKASKNSNFAIEALAGLASQEDFTAVTLKKASEGGISSPDAPYKDLMLLQVKGRRHVQTRLVEPTADNVNSGDCFILVTPTKVFQYVGEFSNVIERSRAAEISLHIQQKGDLGCTTDSVITIGENGRARKDQTEEFWKLLGGRSGPEREAGDVDEDELYESCLNQTNMVYEVVDDELVPNETFWGTIPKIEVLHSDKVLVFDFGSEFYVWIGKNVGPSDRKRAVKVARELWEEGFDYSECALCPLTAASFVGKLQSANEVPESAKAGPVRPSWALFAKVTQNMETVLFREKFLDWPDYSRVIERDKRDREASLQSTGNVGGDVKACDPKAMVENVASQPDLVLEGSHLGRGVRYFDEETRRCSEITTCGVTVWHISEYEYSELPSTSLGQFHMEDSYVVRWHYMITVTGRELSGQPSKHLTTGRDRYAYFCWQGQDSPINDKGAAACLTIELDREHGPQVRVVQGFEPPAFLNLFNGRMIVHKGRRFSDSSPSKHRLFICRGETESESVLFEVPCSMRQLRSAASFILVNNVKAKVSVWHGCKSCPHTRRVTVAAAKHIQETKYNEFGFELPEVTVEEVEEGDESNTFLNAIGGLNRQLYYSLLKESQFQVKTPRLFHLTSVSGEFHFNEIASPYLGSKEITPFPFLQNDLYSASQPALFLLDSSCGLWLWQGWWDGDSESDRGSCNFRFQAERRAAMTTAISYWNLKNENSSSPQAYLIWAGLEPLIFTNQFPFWKDRDDVAELNMKDGRKPGEMVPITAELDALTQTFYPLEQLQNRPLPEGVNPTSLEDYLQPQCFQELFGLEREEFFKLPSWKKNKLKQEAGLF